MIKMDRTMTLGDVGRILIFVAAAGMLYAQAQSDLRNISGAVSQLQQSVVKLNDEVVRLRLEMVETRTSLGNHMIYDEGRKR